MSIMQLLNQPYVLYPTTEEKSCLSSQVTSFLVPEPVDGHTCWSMVTLAYYWQPRVPLWSSTYLQGLLSGWFHSSGWKVDVALQLVSSCTASQDYDTAPSFQHWPFFVINKYEPVQFHGSGGHELFSFCIDWQWFATTSVVNLYGSRS